MRQLSIDLPRLDAQGRADFMVSGANQTALALVDTYPHWPDRRLALTGPEGAGKTHLAAIWAEEHGARRVDAGALRSEDAPELATGPVVVEDVDRHLQGPEGETALFHVWNACARAQSGLLLTGRSLPPAWPVALPDLRSRLLSLTPAILQEPDDALLMAVLVKQLSDRQMTLKPSVLRYILPRMERSFAAARQLVDLLDKESLAQDRPVDLALARDLLGG